MCPPALTVAAKPLCSPATGTFPLESGPQRLGFERAARRVLEWLSTPELPALWVVARKDRGRWLPVAMHGCSPGLGEPAAIAWHDSLCRYAEAAGEPLILGRLQARDAPRRSEQARRLGVAGYMGVPVRAHDGEIHGSLCALFGLPVELGSGSWRPRLAEASEWLHRQLREGYAQRRLFALLERGNPRPCVDPATGLPDRSGWEALLAAEQARIERHACEDGVALLELGGPKDEADRLLRTCTAALRPRLRPFDILARRGEHGLGLLLCDIPARHLESAVGRLLMTLIESEIEATVGWAAAGPEIPLARALLEAEHGLCLRQRMARP